MKGYQGKIIDAHQHVFWHGRDDHGLVRDMDEHGIGVAWLLTAGALTPQDFHVFREAFNPINVLPDGSSCGATLNDALKAREHYPDRFVLGFCPSPYQTEACSILRAAVKMYDVRVCGEWKFRILVDDPRCINLFRTAGQLGLPVIIHLDVPFRPDDKGKAMYDALWFGGTVENLERAVKACPNTVFVGHGPGFWREISSNAGKGRGVYPKGPLTGPGGAVKILSKYPNVWADLSANSCLNALKRNLNFTRRFLKRFSTRVLFGRDSYGRDLFRFLVSLKLSRPLLENIFYKNAERLMTKRKKP
jgi:predicted TIM-barrel fold metal-dependent hydrolase